MRCPSYGIKHIDMPASPARVWQAIQDAKQAKPRNGQPATLPAEAGSPGAGARSAPFQMTEATDLMLRPAQRTTSA